MYSSGTSWAVPSLRRGHNDPRGGLTERTAFCQESGSLVPAQLPYVHRNEPG